MPLSITNPTVGGDSGAWGAELNADLNTIVAAINAISGSTLAPTAVKTSAYTAAASDLVPVDTTSGAVTITLPTAPADKTQVAVKHVLQGGTNAVTIACGGSDVLNKTGGSTTISLPTLNQGIVLQYNASGALWYVLDDSVTLPTLDARFAPFARAGVQRTFDVRDYGAVIDAVTDDSAHVQAAIDAAYAAGGGVVVITGSGTNVSTGGPAAGKACVLNTTLRMKSGVWLRGNGSGTELRGSASPMIGFPTSGAYQDRMAISDLTIVAPAGVGVLLDTTGQSGGLQLGWPRITIENVTVTDAASHGFQIVSSAVIEARFLNCVSMRAGGDGFHIQGTDNFFIGCTAAAGAADGFFIAGANNKLTASKGYANTLNGFNFAGAGRHMASSCETQDNVGAGFAVSGSWNSLAACLADSNNLAGFDLIGPNNVVQAASAMYGGGGSGQVTQVGFKIDAPAIGNVIDGVSNCPVPVGGAVAGNTVRVNSGPGSRVALTYASTIIPDPYAAEIQAVTLTGNLTVGNPANKHAGQRLTFEFTQDATGGRTVTFPATFRTAWTPTTTASAVNSISFEFTGSVWQQIAAVVGSTAGGAAVVDTFNRSDGLVGSATSGQTWQTYNQTTGTWQVVSNQMGAASTPDFDQNDAWIDAGLADVRVKVTIVSTAGYAGLSLRAVDQNNMFRWYGGTLDKIVSGAQHIIAHGMQAPVAGDVVEARLSGASIVLYINGTSIGTCVDPFNIGATKHGLFSLVHTERFDDFSIS